MPHVYTVSFGGTAQAAGAVAILYTAPAEFQSILRDLIVSSSATASLQILILVEVPGSPDLWVWSPVLEPGTTEHLELRQVLEPGWRLKAQAGAGPWTAMATGYQLTAPPP